MKKRGEFVEGWLLPIEGETLRQYATGKDCLEIGSWKGRSSCYIAETAKSLICVDPFCGDEEAQAQKTDFTTLNEFKANTAGYDNITTIIKFSVDAAKDIPDNSLDLIFIDGMHTYEAVIEDIEAWYPKMKEGGFIFFHDYSRDWKGVIKAVDEKFGKPDAVFGGMALVIKKKKDFVLISPYSKQLPTNTENPKNYPYWTELVSLLKSQYAVYQIGAEGERQIPGVDGFYKNQSFEILEEQIKNCKFWISVDNFFPHFVDNVAEKKGIVLFSQSDPEIFGYPYNLNLLEDRKYLRPDQYGLWTVIPFKKEAFVKPEKVFEKIQQSYGQK